MAELGTRPSQALPAPEFVVVGVPPRVRVAVYHCEGPVPRQEETRGQVRGGPGRREGSALRGRDGCVPGTERFGAPRSALRGHSDRLGGRCHYTPSGRSGDEGAQDTAP